MLVPCFLQLVEELDIGLSVRVHGQTKSAYLRLNFNLNFRSPMKEGEPGNDLLALPPETDIFAPRCRAATYTRD